VYNLNLEGNRDEILLIKLIEENFPKLKTSSHSFKNGTVSKWNSKQRKSYLHISWQNY
jgi:hypothetical protein